MTEEDIAARGITAPYWAFAWAGGQALARYILDRPGTVAGKRVLDFGAGSGIASIAAARAGAAPVTASDTDPMAAAAIRLNAALNGAALAVTTEDLVGSPIKADVVLAGDVCYEEPLASRVADWLAFIAAQGTLVLLGDPGRTHCPRSGLTRLALYAGTTTGNLEDYAVRRTAVWRINGD